MALREEEIRDILAQKFALEKRRLKTYKTKTNSFDLANAVTPWVRAFMADSRVRELRRIQKWMEKEQVKSPRVQKYLATRKPIMQRQAQAIQRMAQERQDRRPSKGYSPR